MSKITFKCKGKLADGSPCDKHVSAKMHKGLLDGVRGIKGPETDTKEKNREGFPDIPSDWEFTLTCSRGHEEDYGYGDREK